MIEILTASVIWLFAYTIYLFVRKLRKPKAMDEIKLQKIHVMRLGPFSGKAIHLRVSLLYLDAAEHSVLC